jgi:hypothetical protein
VYEENGGNALPANEKGADDGHGAATAHTSGFSAR